MLATFKTLKCQNGNGGGDEVCKFDEGLGGSPPLGLASTSPRLQKPKLARRISRWKMESLDNAAVAHTNHDHLAAEDGMETEKTRIGIIRVEVERERADGSLGITLRGGMFSNEQLSQPVVITQLKKDGPAARQGIIRMGDRLIAVDGVSLRGSTLTEAQNLLKQPNSSAALTIEYDIKCVDPSYRSNGPLIVEIDKSHSDDLGLTLYQCRDRDSVKIQHIRKGSIAERCGALCEGDEILAINKTRLSAKSMFLSEVQQMLQQSSETVHLEILPARFQADSVTRTWRSRAPLSTNGWYGAGAVTHKEKLEVILIRDSQQDWGLNLADFPDGTVVVSSIQATSSAERSGCLYPGDRIIFVNHRNILNDMLSAEDVMMLMESCVEPRLKIVIEFDVLDTIVPTSGVFNVRLYRMGCSGLGLTIAASPEHSFVICEVKKGSTAHRAGSLLPGDRLLAINDTPLDQFTAENITQILQQSELVSLQLERTQQTSSVQPRRVTCTVELQRYGGPIGITIAGSEEPCQPISVSGLTAGGLAEQTGTLQIGDQILAINGHSLLGQPLSTAYTLLHNSPDLVSLKITRSIMPNGRSKANMSPLQASSADSAVESWASSHFDLNLSHSPEHRKPHDSIETTNTNQEWDTNCKNYDALNHAQLLDEITNKNVNIQIELEKLSQEIRGKDEKLEESSRCCRSGKEEDKEFAEEEKEAELVRGQERESFAPTDIETFEMSNLTESRQWQYLNTSQPSIRSEFQSCNLITADLAKDPIYEDFGFSVSDGLYERGVFINRIRKGGPADLSHQLQPYDRILQVNNTCTQDFDCCLTVPLIATAGERLTLLVARSLSHENMCIHSGMLPEGYGNSQNQLAAFTHCSNNAKRIIV